MLLQLKISFGDSPTHPSNESCKCYNGGLKDILFRRLHPEGVSAEGVP